MYTQQDARQVSPTITRRALQATPVTVSPENVRTATQQPQGNREPDELWDRIFQEAKIVVRDEPLLKPMVHSSVLQHDSLKGALAYRLAEVLETSTLSMQALQNEFESIYVQNGELVRAARADILAVLDRDPACLEAVQPLLFFKGFLALQAHRIAHHCWLRGRRSLSYFIQSRVSELFSIDIHPAARIGRGVMLDHAHSIVIGETAVVGNDVSILHSVTLGGTGKVDGDRHPKIGNGVVIGAGAKVLGNIKVGDHAVVASGSVVLKPVAPGTTVAGVPARPVDHRRADQAATKGEVVQFPIDRANPASEGAGNTTPQHKQR